MLLHLLIFFSSHHELDLDGDPDLLLCFFLVLRLSLDEELLLELDDLRLWPYYIETGCTLLLFVFEFVLAP